MPERSAKTIQALSDRVVKVIREAKAPLKFTDIQKKLRGLERDILKYPIQLAVAQKKIRKRGRTRGTTYQAR